MDEMKMKKPQYLIDSYKKEYSTIIKSIENNRIELDNTIFYPNTGGQPTDTGHIITEDGTEYPVMSVSKTGNVILHEIASEGLPQLKQDQKVLCRIDWDKRYRYMQSHTAAHLISAVISKRTGALITGNQISYDKVRVDFNLDEFDKEALSSYIDEANMIIEKDLKVKDYEMTREDVMQSPEMIKLASGLPEGIEILRIVEIESLDKQPDGGTHVKSLSEIGKMVFTKAENKGKNNRRLQFTLSEE